MLADHLDRLDRRASEHVIHWASPVPFFGMASRAQVATVGINPSNLEFTNGDGEELDGADRRLPTLGSLDLRRWGEADGEDLRVLYAGCNGYFTRRPYDRWFRVLERMLHASGLSYYGSSPDACHVDLFAFATREKWGALPAKERVGLIRSSSHHLGLLLRLMPARLLILNGRSVVDAFAAATGMELESRRVPSWDLPRASKAVAGVAYSGHVDRVAGVPLGRRVAVVGFNHNLQSSFGVSTAVVDAIGRWIALRS